MPAPTTGSQSAREPTERKLVAVLTTSRADSGISRYIVEDLAKSSTLKPIVVCSGDVSPEDYSNLEWNSVYDHVGAIEVVGRRIPRLGDQPVKAAQWVAVCMSECAELLSEVQPDLLLIVGDRIEVLAVAEAAAILGVPIAHVHGGELSFGAVDERCRHAITKLADIHFVATTEYGQRVRQLGEDSNAVFSVGAPGLCALERVSLPGRAEVMDFLGLPHDARYFIATYHPVTTEPDATLSDLEDLLGALALYPDHFVVFTGVNADPGNESVSQMIRSYASTNNNCHVFDSLGHARYLAAVKFADLCIGNSSSGIIEAPALHTPTLNVGSRQAGRSRASSIFDASSRDGDISSAFLAAFKASEERSYDSNPPYGSGGASAKIVSLLEGYSPLPHAPKIFVDLPLADAAKPCEECND